MIRDAMNQYEEFSGDVEAINAYNKTPPLPKEIDPPASPSEKPRSKGK